MLKSHRELLWGLAATGLAMVVFFTFAALGWPGEPSRCTLRTPDTCFCERFIRAGELIKQPANTWGNLGFIAVGLAILWRVGGDRAAIAVRRNPMTAASAYAVAFGALVVFLGPGSMFFHASMTRWGNWLDTFSMILFGSFGLLYAPARVFRWPGHAFLAIYAGLNASLGIFTWLVPGTGTPVFTVLVVIWIPAELLIQWLRPRGTWRRPAWFVAALGTFAAALVIWSLSQTARPLCDPDSLLQGHALWHVLCAVAAGFVFLYLRTEGGDEY